MSAFVRVSGPPNSNFLVGYPGISATLVRLYAVRMSLSSLRMTSLLHCYTEPPRGLSCSFHADTTYSRA